MTATVCHNSVGCGGRPPHHSMVIDPWGHIVAQCSDSVGTVGAVLDFDYSAKVRANVPVANHHVL
ncbi:nitrilase-related carbon-nitrogen hydrolase [Agrobacterium tumefaciens]|uniref:nitrilase-related carbon-nitrogen hydrolase n=1 Tax=Agrobacterium tumefaciens TaxID=358 RepID=UPI0030135626